MGEQASGIELQRRPAGLGVAIGLEFDCSIPAGHANNLAEELVKNPELLGHLSRKNISVMGSDGGYQETRVIKIVKHSIVTEQPMRLALIQPNPNVEIQRDATPKCLGIPLGRKVVKPCYERVDGEPMLVALFGGVALPLAGFQRRKNGQCSYVQIGTEINEDSLHALSTDDEAGRNTILEAIIETLGNQIEWTTTASQRKKAIQKLLDYELQKHEENGLLATAFEAELVRMSSGVRQCNRGDLIILDNDPEGTEKLYEYTRILDETRLADGRRVGLVMASPKEGLHQDMSYLMALTRGMLALPIASLNGSTGQIEFQSSELNKPGEQRKQLVHQLLALVNDKPLMEHYKKTPAANGNHAAPTDDQAELRQKVESEMLQFAANEEDRIIANWFYRQQKRKGFIRPGETGGNYLINDEELTINVEEELERYLTNILDIDNPYPRSPLLNIVAQRSAAAHSARQQFLEVFDVQARLTDSLGETTKEDENLVREFCNRHLGLLSKYEGTIPNLDFGNRHADAVVQFVIQRDGAYLRVTVKGRPKDNRDEPLKPIPSYGFGFYITRPIGAQLEGKRPNVQELGDAFRYLQAVIN